MTTLESILLSNIGKNVKISTVTRMRGRRNIWVDLHREYQVEFCIGSAKRPEILYTHSPKQALYWYLYTMLHLSGTASVGIPRAEILKMLKELREL